MVDISANGYGTLKNLASTTEELKNLILFN